MLFFPQGWKIMISSASVIVSVGQFLDIVSHA